MSRRWLVVMACVLVLTPARGDSGESLPAGALARLTHPEARSLGRIDALVVSPGDKFLATVGYGRGVRLWFLDGEGRTLADQTILNEASLAIAVSPDGKHIAAGGWNQAVSIWDVKGRRDLDSLAGHTAAITSLAFSPDGAQLLSGSDDRSVRLWNWAQAAELKRFEGHQGLITAVAFGPEAKTVYSASLDRTVRVWDAATGKELRRLEGHRDQVLAFRVIPGGPIVTASMDHTIRLWDTATGKELAVLTGHDLGVTSLDVSADGKRLLSGGLDGQVRLWDLAARRCLSTITACPHGVRAVAFLTDGDTLVSGDAEGMVRRWDAATGKELRFTNGSRGEAPSAISSLTWSPDGRQVATAGAEGVRLWDAGTGKMQRLLGRHMDTVWGVDWAPDGKTIVSVGRRDGSIHSYDAVSHKETFRYGFAHQGGVSRAAFSRDGRFLATGGGTFDPTIYLWDAGSGKSFAALKAPMDFLDGVAWAPDGKRLASVSRDGALRVWDVAAAKEQRIWRGPLNGFRCLAWSPDGRWLATAGDDQGAALRDPDGLREPLFLGHDGASQAVAFSPDGRTLAVGAADEARSLLLWEVATGQLRVKYPGHPDSITALAFSPDGRKLAAGSYGSTLIWDVTGLAGAEAKARLVDVDALWERLGGDAEAAHPAVWALSAAPSRGLTVLKKRLRPAESLDPKIAGRWLKELDDSAFSVRDRARRELEKLGDQAEGALRAALLEGNSLEFRLRVQALLARLEGPKTTPQRLRQLRALEVLELMATPAAADFLRELSRGDPQATLTLDAKATLARLAPQQ